MSEEHNSIIRNALGKYRGIEVKHTGDGFMASFASVTDVLGCAIAVQRAISDYNANVTSDDERFHVRIGIGAAFEDLQDSGLLGGIVDELGALTRDSEPQVRADACHYLGMTNSPSALHYVQPLLDDPDEEVREIAAETLPLLPTA